MQISHVLFMRIRHVLFMQINHVLHDDCGQKRKTAVRDHHHWMGILMMLLGKQTIKIIKFAK